MADNEQNEDFSLPRPLTDTFQPEEVKEENEVSEQAGELARQFNEDKRRDRQDRIKQLAAKKIKTEVTKKAAKEVTKKAAGKAIWALIGWEGLLIILLIIIAIFLALWLSNLSFWDKLKLVT